MQIGKQNQIKPGDNAELASEDGSIYKTMVEDCSTLNELIISAPMYRGVPVGLQPGRKLGFFYFRDSGRFGFDVTVLERINEGHLVLYRMKVTSPLRREQRRGAFRLKIALPVDIRFEEDGVFIPGMEDDKTESSKTIDISETGLAFFTRNQYDINRKLFAKVHFNEDFSGDSPVVLWTQVMRTQTLIAESGTNLVGIHFIAVEEATRMAMSRFIIQSQQAEMRKLNFGE